MSGPVRRAGWGRLEDGSTATWVVAEGRRGRRWREVVTRASGTVHALLLETDPDGRFSHLELARGDGLWTFHPESDGTLHGNHVRRGEDVRHVTGWPFGPGDAIVVEGSPISLAAVAQGRAAGLAVGARDAVDAVVIRADGELVRERAVRLERLAPTRWRLGEGSVFEVDDAGLPVLAGGATRPLELA